LIVLVFDVAEWSGCRPIQPTGAEHRHSTEPKQS